MKNDEKKFAQISAAINSAPSDVQSAGHEIYEFCKAISNNGVADRGAGYGSYDIWFKYGEKELYINIKESSKA